MSSKDQINISGFTYKSLIIQSPFHSSQDEKDK